MKTESMTLFGGLKMSKENQPYKPMNSAALSLEIQMGLDNLKAMLPLIIEQNAVNAKILNAKYKSLLQEGFTEAQALSIIQTRPLAE